MTAPGEGRAQTIGLELLRSQEPAEGPVGPHRDATSQELALAGRLADSLAWFSIFRGGLWEATLRRVTPRQYTRLTGRPEWATVRTLTLLRGRSQRTQQLPAKEVAELLSAPVMGSLRTVRGLDLPTLAALGQGPRLLPLETLHVQCDLDEVFPAGRLEALTRVRLLGLEGCSAEHLRALLASEWLGRLRVLEAGCHTPADVSLGLVLELLRRGTELTSFCLGPFAGLREEGRWSLELSSEGLDPDALAHALHRLGFSLGALTLSTPGRVDPDYASRLQAIAELNQWSLRLDEGVAGCRHLFEESLSTG